MDYLKWQEITKYAGGGSVAVLTLVILILNLAGMTYAVPEDITCGIDCYSEVWVNSTYWEVCAEHSGDREVMYKKISTSRRLWVNLDKIDNFVETNPEVEVELMVRTTSAYATVKHEEYGYLRPVKDGDCFIKRKSEKYYPNGYKFYIHGSKEATQTVKWGMNLDSLLSAPISFDPIWHGEGGWTIEGNRVYIDDSNAFIQAEPHTLTGSEDVYFDFTPKTYTGDVDVIWGFDTDEVRPTDAWIYSPYEVNTTHSYTCTGDYFNYTLNPKHFYCWNLAQDNDTLEWFYELEDDGDFEWGDIPSKTAYWNTTKIVDYKELSGAFQSIDYEYGGMNKWWYKKDVSVVAGENYRLKVRMVLPFNQESSGKYWFAIKPSGETIQEAITNGHLYYLDPWWDTVTYGYGYEILSTALVAGMPIRLNDTDGVGPTNIGIWTNNSSAVETKWLVSTGAGATGTLDVGNENDRTPWENESSLIGYLPENVWPDYEAVLHAENVTMTDSTSNRIVFTKNGDPTETDSGVFGGAVQLDGTGDFWTFPDLGMWDSDWTIEFWFYPEESERTCVFSLEGEKKLELEFDYVSLGQVDTINSRMVYGGDAQYMTCEGPIDLNTWHYVVLVANNSLGDAYLYLNNTLCDSVSDFGTLDAQTKLNTLGKQSGAARELQGRYDGVRISTVPRDEAYIDAVWKMGHNNLGTLGVEETPAPPDTCTYTSGDWNIDCSDNCQLDTNTDIGSNNLILTGTGEITINADLIVGDMVVGDGCSIVFEDGKTIVYE